METLGEKQERFSRSLWRLLQYAEDQGIGVRMGECYRSKAEAKRLAVMGRGIVNSNHTRRLAVDLYLSVAGKVLWDGWPYEMLGDFWKSMGDDYRWGGDFKNRRDVYHFSIKHRGVI